jgi:hypothetical protein
VVRSVKDDVPSVHGASTVGFNKRRCLDAARLPRMAVVPVGSGRQVYRAMRTGGIPHQRSRITGSVIRTTINQYRRIEFGGGGGADQEGPVGPARGGGPRPGGCRPPPYASRVSGKSPGRVWAGTANSGTSTPTSRIDADVRV